MPAIIIALPPTLRMVIGFPKKIRSNKRIYTYAAGWQVMLKKFNLGVAYANRSAVVIWGILLAWLCLGEALSWTLAAGAALVIGGIILVSTEEAHE